MSGRPSSQGGRLSRPRRRSPARIRGTRDWGAVGCALAVALYAFTEAKLRLPRFGLVILGAAAATSLLVALGLWQTLAAAFGRNVGRVLRQSQRKISAEMVIEACADAASSLSALLSQPQLRSQDPWWREVPRSRLNRQVLRAYDQTCRWKCIAALVQAEAVVSVPAEIRSIAAMPRKASDLHSLELWFATAAGALRDTSPWSGRRDWPSGGGGAGA